MTSYGLTFYLVLGLIVGVGGSLIGGLVAYLLRQRSARMMSFTLEFAGGMMLAVVCFDLLPHAFDHAGLMPVLFGVFTGMGFIFLTEELLSHAQGPKKSGNTGMLVTALTMAAGIALHNFPEGIAVGAGFEGDAHLGVTLALAILLHNIPEGLSVALPLKIAGRPLRHAVTVLVLAEIPMCIGTLVGGAMGAISHWFISISLAAAGGAMLYVVMADMIPESKRMYGGRLSSVGSILGMIFGIVISVGLG